MKGFPLFKLLVPALLVATPVLASSEAAWEEFRAEVETRCRALAPEAGKTEIEVNPFGSESFGAAIVTTTVEGSAPERSICIYDKKARTAELTGAFPTE